MRLPVLLVTLQAAISVAEVSPMHVLRSGLSLYIRTVHFRCTLRSISGAKLTACDPSTLPEARPNEGASSEQLDSVAHMTLPHSPL
jgi:hypothetical protein